MSLSTEQAQALLDKLGELPSEKLAEVEDFIDFLRLRQEEGSFAALSTRLSAPVLQRIWDNPQDAAYDQL